MIGNDVVDLAAVRSRPSHARFDERVMAPSERKALAESGSPDALRWTLWASKEAAYKAARQLDSRLSFSPRRFVVALDAKGGGAVEHETAGRFPLHVDLDAARVHVVSRAEGLSESAIRSRIRCLEGRPNAAGQSREARRLAVEMLSSWLDLAPDSFAIRSEDRVPTLWVQGAASPIRLSLSHHGRFVAAACVRREPEPSSTRPDSGAVP